ncbi:hypothetical protein [Pseudobutyrivibrio sp.]
MTDFLTENSLYYQSSSFSSSYFFTNQNYKNYDFKNAIETSTNEALNDVDASFENDSKGKTSYTRIVSASVMTSQMSAIASSNGGTAYSYQGVMQKFEIRIDVTGDERKYIATGTDKDGKEFSKEIDPYNVDPTDADFTEFAALCSYIRDTENLADETMKFVDSVAADDIFERMNYLSAFSAEVGKFEFAGLSNLAAEKLMPHINRLMEVLINSGIVNIEGQAISEADVSFERESTDEVMDVQNVLKMLIETYSKLESKNEEDDWRGMSDEEWEKLLARVDNDINAMIELIREEAEKAKETHQKEDELDEQAAEEI